MYRVGKKQKRVILDENGIEVATFRKGNEWLAKKTCELLNESMKRNPDIAVCIKELIKNNIIHTTVGKEYPITNLGSYYFSIIDEDNIAVFFPNEIFNEYFKYK